MHIALVQILTQTVQKVQLQRAFFSIALLLALMDRFLHPALPEQPLQPPLPVVLAEDALHLRPLLLLVAVRPTRLGLIAGFMGRFGGLPLVAEGQGVLALDPCQLEGQTVVQRGFRLLTAEQIRSGVARGLHPDLPTFLLVFPQRRPGEVHQLSGVGLQRNPETGILQKFRRPGQREGGIEVREGGVGIPELLWGEAAGGGDGNFVLAGVVLEEAQGLAEGPAVGEFLLEEQSVPQTVAAGLEQLADQPQEGWFIRSQGGGAVAGEVGAEPDPAAAGGGEPHQLRGGQEGAEAVAEPLHADERLLQQVEQLEQRQFPEFPQPHGHLLRPHRQHHRLLRLRQHPAVLHPHHRQLRFRPPLVHRQLLLQLQRGQSYLRGLQIQVRGLELVGETLGGGAALEQPVRTQVVAGTGELERSHLILFIQGDAGPQKRSPPRTRPPSPPSLLFTPHPPSAPNPAPRHKSIKKWRVKLVAQIEKGGWLPPIPPPTARPPSVSLFPLRKTPKAATLPQIQKEQCSARGSSSVNGGSGGGEGRLWGDGGGRGGWTGWRVL